LFLERNYARKRRTDLLSGSDSNLNLDYGWWRHDPVVAFLTLTRLPASVASSQTLLISIASVRLEAAHPSADFIIYPAVLSDVIEYPSGAF